MIEMHTFVGLGRIDMFKGLTILWTFNQGFLNSSIENRHFFLGWVLKFVNCMIQETHKNKQCTNNIFI